MTLACVSLMTVIADAFALPMEAEEIPVKPEPATVRTVPVGPDAGEKPAIVSCAAVLAGGAGVLAGGGGAVAVGGAGVGAGGGAGVVVGGLAGAVAGGAADVVDGGGAVMVVGAVAGVVVTGVVVAGAVAAVSVAGVAAAVVSVDAVAAAALEAALAPVLALLDSPQPASSASKAAERPHKIGLFFIPGGILVFRKCAFVSASAL